MSLAEIRTRRILREKADYKQSRIRTDFPELRQRRTPGIACELYKDNNN